MGPGTSFAPVLADEALTSGALPSSAITSVVLTTGKMYYDIVEERNSRGRGDVAVLRIEELAPFPSTALATALSEFKGLKKVVWAQQEPHNCGAWSWVRPFVDETLKV